MNIQKERSRLEQLMLSMANSKNPFNNFMWGKMLAIGNALLTV